MKMAHISCVTIFIEEGVEWSTTATFLGCKARDTAVYTALQGGSIMKGWTNDDRVMIACCNDGTRPVIFKIERIDIPENDEEAAWLEKPEIVCTHAAYNNQCIGKRCPFSRANHKETTR